MSKLESAFSKALREQALNKGQQSPTAQGVQASEPSLNGRELDAKKLKEIVSSTAQIREMSHKVLLSEEELRKKRLIYPKIKDKTLLNVYRNLRTKLLAESKSKNFVTMVTSVVPTSISDLVAANLAATFAFDTGKTSLLIEGNVHSPTLAKLFNLDEGHLGLMECLESEDTAVNEILYETGIPRLRFIPCGEVRENAAEYFTSLKMKELIEEVKNRYPERYPIIDAPSINGSADARILLDLCDRVLLVIPYGKCSKEDIRVAAKLIGSAKLVGTVLSQF